MKILILLVSTYASISAYSQNKVLKLFMVNHESNNGIDSLDQISQRFIADIHQKDASFNYSDVNYKQTDFMNSPHLVEESTIGSMKAGNFIYCNKRLSKKLIPILIVKKDGQSIPYYTSYFIVNKNSNIESLNSSGIKKLYYVDEKSASGYIQPFHKLWESGVISKPSIKAAKEKFGDTNVIKAGSHEEVIQRINDDNAFNSIGLCGEIPDSTSNSVILLRYSLLPQDVIYVSQNLKQYISIISEWLIAHSNSRMISNSSTRITGLVDFQLEHKAAYLSLEKTIDRVEFSESHSNENKFEFEDINSPSHFFSFLKTLKFSEIAIIFGLLTSLFSAGITIGIKYPKIVSIFK